MDEIDEINAQIHFKIGGGFGSLKIGYSQPGWAGVTQIYGRDGNTLYLRGRKEDLIAFARAVEKMAMSALPKSEAP